MPTPPSVGHVTLGGSPLLLSPYSYMRYKSPFQQTFNRLGQPRGVGIGSTWRQSSWLGGVGQNFWQDEKMYFWGDADTREGYVQCKTALRPSTAWTGDDASSPQFNKALTVRPLNETAVPKIYVAYLGARYFYSLDNPNSAQTLVRDTGVSTWATAMGRSRQGGMFGMHFGQANGQIFSMASGSNVIGVQVGWDAGNGQVRFFSSLGPSGTDYAGAARTIFKVGEGSKWQKVATLDLEGRSAAPWNHMLWIVGTDGVQESKLYQTDGITAKEVHHWPDGFIAKKIVSHYGQLYILGDAPNDTYSKTIGQLWVYNGASMRLLWETPEEIWLNHPRSLHGFAAACGWRKWLLFTVPYYGLFAHDSEQDAIHPAFSFEGATDNDNNYATDIVVWSHHVTAILRNRKAPHSTHLGTKYETSKLVSSQYDAGLPDVNKTWNKVRVEFEEKLATGAQVKVYVTTDHVTFEQYPPATTEWKLVGTITGTGGSEEATLVINGEVDFVDFNSRYIRYMLELIPAGSGTFTPKVSAVDFDFTVGEQPKTAWSFAALAANRLKNPDDTWYTGGPGYTTATPDFTDRFAAEANLLTMLRTTGANVMTFVDKDGTSYKVRLTDWRQNEQRVNEDPLADAPGSQFTIQIAEV